MTVENKSLSEETRFRKEAESAMAEMAACRDIHSFCPLFRKYLLSRFMLDDSIAEDNLYQLGIHSIKKNQPKAYTGPADDVLNTYDCTREELAIRKKTLLIISMEKQLGIRLEDDAASDAETILQLANAFWAAMQNRTGGRE